MTLKQAKPTPLDRILSSAVDIGYHTQWPGIRTAITLPDGQQIEYQYDQLQLKEIQVNGNIITQIQHDVLGRETDRQQGQLNTHSDYDPMGRLVKQQAINQASKQSTIQREYGYDPFNNLNYLKDGQHETHYLYDELNRLKKAVQDGQTEQFDFDPAGNIVAISEQSESLKNNANIKGNRLTLQGDKKFSYDERGNLIKETRGKGGKLVTTFSYNLQNQLTAVTKEGQTTQYKYDPLGRRFEKSDSFGTTRYLWAENQMVQETRNNIKKTYVYEPNSFKPVALVQDEQIYHYHLDHLGTPRELTNNAGDIVWKVRYKTYGNVAVKEVDEIENNIRFQGQYFDEESGLHYNRHRYYNPSSGQFISQDPIGLLGGINNYQYAPNPTGWVDPLGLSCKEVDFYVGSNEQVIPSTGYRAFGGESNVNEALSGTISPRDPTYITFDDITNMNPDEAKSFMQLPRSPTHAVEFDTLQVIDDIKTPDGKWNTNGIPEPITETFPEWGAGGATQAITNKPIKIDSSKIVELGVKR